VGSEKQKYRINQTITTKDTFSVIINSENAFFAERVLSSVINSTNSNYKIAIAYPRQQEKSFNDMLEIFANRTSSNGLTEIIPYVKESSHESIFNFILNDMKESDYYCFLDESAVILGFAQDGKDWLQFMHSDFNLRSNIGAISPLSSWSDELQCQTLDFCCMFTSKKVLGVVGKFDYSLGSSKLIDWSYRCIAAGFDLKEIESGEFPFYYVPEGPSNIVTRELLSKYDVNKVRDLYRTVYPFTPEQNSIKGTKLNLGCYYMYIPGFVNVDIKEEVGADLVCDLMDIKKHYKNNTVSLILISQCLEHFSLQDGRDLIGYLHDILVPGGHLIIEVPDGDDIDGKFHRGEIDKGLYDVIKNGTPHEKHQDHKAVYTETELMRVLKFYGFKSICRRPIHMTSNQMEAIRIDCIK
jgi:predicted SAM-dependent methyltransferase